MGEWPRATGSSVSVNDMESVTFAVWKMKRGTERIVAQVGGGILVSGSQDELDPFLFFAASADPYKRCSSLNLESGGTWGFSALTSAFAALAGSMRPHRHTSKHCTRKRDCQAPLSVVRRIAQ